jgi:DNA-binding winged helix-turn-helix (wHTH) protein/tetratricopeptide (TPR) repeat protein
VAGAEHYSFTPFTLDVRERRLSRAGAVIALPPKTLDLLVALVRNAGRLLRKADLLAVVWPETFVEEGIISVHVSALRKVLGSDFIETVPRVGYRFNAAVTGVDEPAAIAVLPARPLANEPFSGRDGAVGVTIAEAIIERLGTSAQLYVRPLRAVKGYPNLAADPATAGQALRVSAVVECTFFTTTAGRVHATARLVRTSDGTCLWTGEFDTEPCRILSIAEAVAREVASYLSLTVRNAGPSPPALPPEAYELFGIGRSRLLSASRFEVPKAVEAFRTAASIAPGYASAHAGLALAHCAETEYRLRPPNESFADARAAALRALGIDDSCADAQVALGAVMFLSDWNWMAAARSLERALMLQPNHTEAYLLYGRVLEATGELEKGLAMKLRALERDPLSPMVQLQIALSYFYQRRFDDCIQWGNRTLSLDSSHPFAREHIAAAYWMKGDADGWISENLKHAQSHGAPAEVIDTLRDAYREGGRAGVVRMILERAAAQPQAAPAMQLALFCAEAGDLDAAFLHLNRALDERDPALVHLAVGPQWDPLRVDAARFKQCVARLGLAG